jgi:hypothetical protein
MTRNWLIMILSAGLTLAVTGIVTGEMRRRRRVRELDDGLITWEGEGGQIPGATPASSIPGTTVHSGPLPPSALH